MTEEMAEYMPCTTSSLYLDGRCPDGGSGSPDTPDTGLCNLTEEERQAVEFDALTTCMDSMDAEACRDVCTYQCWDDVF